MEMVVEPEPPIQVIELHMMHPERYIPLTLLSGFTIRSLLYPFSVIKTRLQIQRQKHAYRGTFDALYKIAKYEGRRGLYRGYWVTSLQIVPQTTYILTYETTRHLMNQSLGIQDSTVRSFVGGLAASLVSQTFIVPIDVVSQHLMLLGSEKSSNKGRRRMLGHISIPDSAMKTSMSRTKAIVNSILKQDGFKGFYRGYLTSLAVYAPNSALWWTIYDVYCGILGNVSPEFVPRLALQCTAACGSAVTTSLILNPVDLVRTRVQVEGLKFMPTCHQLWKEERMRLFIKGLSARLVLSISFSFFIILGYETLKRWSLKDEYKDKLKW